MAERETAEHISQEQMIERGDTNLAEALRWIPGVYQNGGHPGSETGNVGARGVIGGITYADALSYVVDGIVLGAGDGDSFGANVDPASIQVGGIESIDVMKGYTSVLLGPNISLGAIVVKTRKPQRGLELNTRTGIDMDAGGFGASISSLTAGTRLGMFYARLGVQEKYVDHWRLSESFKPRRALVQDGGVEFQGEGNRVFSDSNTFGLNTIFGANPLDNLDIWATYTFNNRDEGWAPPRTNGTLTPRADSFNRFRHSATINAEWEPDRFSLGLHGYFEANLQTNGKPYPYGSGDTAAVTRWESIQNGQVTESYFKNYSYGANLNGSYEINDWSKIAAALQFRQNIYNIDAYKTGTLEDQTRWINDYVENIYFGGAEYTVKPFKAFTAVAGFGVDMLAPVSMKRIQTPGDVSLSADAGNFNAIPQWAVAAFYDLAEHHELRLTYAKKNRFPAYSEKQAGTDTHSNSISDTTKPNPDLKPQQAHHFEFGYKGYFLDRIRIMPTVYLDYELDKIASVTLVDDPDGFTSQRENINKNLYYGFEFSMEMFLNDYFNMGGSFSISTSKILEYYTNPANPIKVDYTGLGGFPLFTANGYFTITPFTNMDTGIVKNIRFIPRFEYFGDKYTGSPAPDNNWDRNASSWYAGYVLVHFGAFTNIGEHFTASFSINNLFDKLYYWSQEAPGKGRTFNISVGYTY
ncbi:MAG: TonB-dependent receptor [Spirochaetaceae bacterium]|jgi:outer membrane receptor protein involved in Fe transport|nr:TonB-dependent receptor [Spirochaetaceae bacterium]